MTLDFYRPLGMVLTVCSPLQARGEGDQKRSKNRTSAKRNRIEERTKGKQFLCLSVPRSLSVPCSRRYHVGNVYRDSCRLRWIVL